MEIIDCNYVHGYPACGYEITWSDGTVTRINIDSPEADRILFAFANNLETIKTGIVL